MAGGPLANEIACMECLISGKLTKATRIREGVESDQYRCDEGHEFGIDFRRGPAIARSWPPPPELEAMVKKR